jgi:hypothetical protein
MDKEKNKTQGDVLIWRKCGMFLARVFVCGARDETRGLTHARQVLYH